MSSPAKWTTASCIVALAGLAFVAVSANGDPPNTGMADPVALVSAFDRFAAGGAPANVVILSLSNLRGVSSEAVNAGGRVQVNLATGLVTSVARLLPADGTFDLWLVDNQSGAAHTTLADAPAQRLNPMIGLIEVAFSPRSMRWSRYSRTCSAPSLSGEVPWKAAKLATALV